MAYEIHFNVTAKAQTTEEDGSTKFVTILQSIGEEVGGVITVTTADPAVDAFFVTNGDFVTSVEPVV